MKLKKIPFALLSIFLVFFNANNNCYCNQLNSKLLQIIPQSKNIYVKVQIWIIKKTKNNYTYQKFFTINQQCVDEFQKEDAVIYKNEIYTINENATLKDLKEIIIDEVDQSLCKTITSEEKNSFKSQTRLYVNLKFDRFHLYPYVRPIVTKSKDFNPKDIKNFNKVVDYTDKILKNGNTKVNYFDKCLSNSNSLSDNEFRENFFICKIYNDLSFLNYNFK